MRWQKAKTSHDSGGSDLSSLFRKAMRRRWKVGAGIRGGVRQKQHEREILEIVDREQERLGRELHDGLCQTLAGIAVRSSTLSKRLADSDVDGAAAAAEISELLRGAIAETRGLARGLDPVALAHVDLGGALAALAGNVRHLFGVACTFTGASPSPELDVEAAAHLFRIVQEAVSNALTHGRPTRIEITLGTENGHGLLSIRDDGVGLPAETPSGAGIGLHTMARRSLLIGAGLEVRRRAGRGTAVLCAFPLAAC